MCGGESPTKSKVTTDTRSWFRSTLCIFALCFKTPDLHVVACLVYDPQRTEEIQLRMAPPIYHASLRVVLLQLLMNERSGSSTFPLSPSCSVTMQLKHVALTRGGLWRRAELALVTLDERLITLIWVEMSSGCDRILQRDAHFDRGAEKVSDIYCYKFWQLLFVFRWRRDAEGFSERWLIVCTWLSIASTRGA